MYYYSLEIRTKKKNDFIRFFRGILLNTFWEFRFPNTQHTTM